MHFCMVTCTFSLNFSVCVCVFVCVCVCVCCIMQTLKHSSNSLTGHRYDITHSRWCCSSNMITNKAGCWGQIPPSQSSWMGRRSGREEEEGGGEAGVVGGGGCWSRPEQGALYNDWLFTWWLIVLHRPVCGLRRPAHMFAEWHTVLSVSGCHVGMFGVPFLQRHTRYNLHCMRSTCEDSNLHSNVPYWLSYCQSRLNKVHLKERIIIWGNMFTSFPRLHFFYLYTKSCWYEHFLNFRGRQFLHASSL